MYNKQNEQLSREEKMSLLFDGVEGLDETSIKNGSADKLNNSYLGIYDFQQFEIQTEDYNPS